MSHVSCLIPTSVSHSVDGKSIDGKSLSSQILHTLEHTIRQHIHKKGRSPHLAIIDTQNRLDSRSFIKQKCLAAKKVGIDISFYEIFDAQKTKDKLSSLNHNPNIDGIVLQMPLQQGWNYQDFVSLVGFNKDVDGLFTNRLSRYICDPTIQNTDYWPNTIEAVKIILHHMQFPFIGKHVVIFGGSPLIGIPQFLYFSKMGCTVSMITKESTKDDMITAVSNAQIIIFGTPEPKFIKASLLPKGALIIDIGFHKEEKRIVGNVDMDKTDHLWAYTPVPGGIGPLTVACLMRQVVQNWLLA